MVMLDFMTSKCAYAVHEATDAQHLADLLSDFINDPETLKLFLGLESAGVPVGAYMKEGEVLRVTRGSYPQRPEGDWEDFVKAARAALGPEAHPTRVNALALRKMWALPDTVSETGPCAKCGKPPPFALCPNRGDSWGLPEGQKPLRTTDPYRCARGINTPTQCPNRAPEHSVFCDEHRRES